MKNGLVILSAIMVEDIADDQHSHHQLRINRGPAGMAVERGQLAVQPVIREISV